MKTKEKKGYWLFTIMTEYNHYVNCYFDEFPTKKELTKVCHYYNASSYAIVNVTELTEEQYNKLTEEDEE